MVFPKPLHNKKALVTCGPTWVPIDRARVISNISTGELGQLIGRELYRAGAKVTLVEGPVTQPVRYAKDIRVIRFQFYEELLKILDREMRRNYHIIVHAAAVSDYQPINTYGKISSDLSEIRLNLKPTKKIINEFKKFNRKAFLVGFKLEFGINKELLIQRAARLFLDAQCDLVVANSLEDKNYSGCIVDKNKNILAEAGSRQELSTKLLALLKERV